MWVQVKPTVFNPILCYTINIILIYCRCMKYIYSQKIHVKKTVKKLVYQGAALMHFSCQHFPSLPCPVALALTPHIQLLSPCIWAHSDLSGPMWAGLPTCAGSCLSALTHLHSILPTHISPASSFDMVMAWLLHLQIHPASSGLQQQGHVLSSILHPLNTPLFLYPHCSQFLVVLWLLAAAIHPVSRCSQWWGQVLLLTLLSLTFCTICMGVDVPCWWWCRMWRWWGC